MRFFNIKSVQRLGYRVTGNTIDWSINTAGYLKNLRSKRFYFLNEAKMFILLLFICIGCNSDNDNDIQVGKKLVPIHNNVKGNLNINADSIILKPELGLTFYKGQPFNGTSISHYPSGIKSSSIQYVNGKKHGSFLKWFDDGVKSFEANYLDGKQHGTTASWWRNENLRSKANFTKGITNGIQEQWYVSGAKFKTINLVDGKEEGLQRSWRENGKIYNNYEAKNGRIFGLKRATLCYALDDEIVQYNNK